MAMLAAALIAMITMALYKRGEKSAVNRTVNTALTSGGMVILISLTGLVAIMIAAVAPPMK